MVAKKKEIAILPLEDAILFPHMVLPMHIFEDSYIQLIDFAMGSTKKIAITLKKPGFETEPAPGTICCVGDITYSEDAEFLENEGKAIIVSGTERAEIKRVVQNAPFITTELRTLTDTCSSQTIFDQCRERLSKKLIRFLFITGVPDRDIHLANLIVDPGHIADFVAYYLIDDVYTKMKLLETDDVCLRCQEVEKILDKLLETATSHR